MRGTLGIDKEVAAGFEAIRLRFDISAPQVSEEPLSKLIEKTERYWTVLQTLTAAPAIERELVTAWRGELTFSANSSASSPLKIRAKHRRLVLSAGMRCPQRSRVIVIEEGPHVGRERHRSDPSGGTLWASASFRPAHRRIGACRCLRRSRRGSPPSSVQFPYASGPRRSPPWSTIFTPRGARRLT